MASSLPKYPGGEPRRGEGAAPPPHRAAGAGPILVLNAGSSSLKAEIFTPGLESRFAARVLEIGGTATFRTDRLGEQRAAAPDHDAALALVLDAAAAAGIALAGLSAAAHRVVHGGAEFAAPARITPRVLAAIESFIPLAPLHNPANLAGIRAMTRLAPALRQYASFDTAFHATNPDLATTYALPPAERARGIRRYGFHGQSYAGIVGALAPLPRRLLAFHLGNGASLAAILDGRSVATSMGYSPLDGLVMGTRSGAIDGMAVLRLAEIHGIAGAARLLNHDSGLRALAGTNDMRALLARSDPEARFAVEHFCYWAARQAGSAIAAMGGLDAIAFTGGIGEHAAPVRARILELLAWAGPVPVHVVPAEEERLIAAEALALMRAGQ
ncbi:MAG: acetate kinase [Rubellimicrobium sp.]|nr:acetate kinase [Rubellimicrobium sp.]